VSNLTNKGSFEGEPSAGSNFFDLHSFWRITPYFMAGAAQPRERKNMR